MLTNLPISKKQICRFMCAGAIALQTGIIQAGGLYANEFNTLSMGTAGAGQEALADSASTNWVFHNPAGMSRLEGRNLHVGGGFAATRIEFDPDPDTPKSGGDGGDAGGVLPIGGFSYTQSLSDKWSVGVTFGGLSGAALDFDDDWTGRFQVQEVELTVFALNPNVAYKINDQWSIGAGATVSYSILDFEVAAGPLGRGQIKLDELDDFAYSFNAGVLYEPRPGTRFGLIYATQMDLDFGGDGKADFVRIERRGNVNTKINLPQLVRLGFYHDINRDFALLGSVGWEDWSALGDQYIGGDRISGDIPRNWEDTWRYGVGLHYRVNDQWLLQTGFMYDTNPVGSGDRTADLPVDRQMRYAVGTRYKMRDGLTIHSALVYADLGKARINSDDLKGDFKNNDALFFSLDAEWSW